jgi:hypothetical protein
MTRETTMRTKTRLQTSLTSLFFTLIAAKIQFQEKDLSLFPTDFAGEAFCVSKMELDETGSESGDKLDEHYCYVCNVVLDPPLVPVVEHPRGLPIPVCLSCEGKRAEKR